MFIFSETFVQFILLGFHRHSLIRNRLLSHSRQAIVKSTKLLHILIDNPTLLVFIAD